jgi:hypothetical protein
MLTGPFNARRSNAKTAYELMSDIAAYVMEEPKRLWMGDWIIEGEAEIEDFFDTQGPACGTVGCIAGNAVVLTGQTQNGRSTATTATEILAGDNHRLGTSVQCLFLNTEVEAKYGSEKYAQIVVERIKRFQEKYETELRGVKIEQ